MVGKNHTFSIASDHPILIDHFPGNPLVPGAIILDHILLGYTALNSDDFLSLVLKEIKFKSPLRGDETTFVSYWNTPQGSRFSARVGDREIASGLITSKATLGV
ncbi:MAG: hypothetical protein RLZ25_1451 [Pseudomonadota bacterium]|jgi:3-hydroxymyristoyl/3-hydroxydecanoyl-(acyl carrier protein) dehydratase